jgi:accessory gene regulator B
MHSLAINLAKKLGNSLHSGREQIDIYTYGLEVLLMTLITLAVVFCLAQLLSSTATTLIFLAVFAPFRSIGGGSHLSTYPRCLLFGTCLMVGLGYWAGISIQPYTLLGLLSLTTILALYSIVKWIPADTVKRPITDERIKSRQKLYMLLAVCSWFTIAAILTRYGLLNYALAMVMGALGSIFLIAPWGYWLLEAIDKTLNNMKGGEANA